MPIEIYLLRHGQTQWNVEKKLQGIKDSPLTELGRKQGGDVGRILARQFGSLCPYPLYVSPLKRAQDTAVLVQQSVAFSKVVTDDRLHEVSFGDWEGLSMDEVSVIRPECGEFYVPAPGGESLDEVLVRLDSFTASLQGPAVVLCHGMLGQILRGTYTGLPMEQALVLPVPQDTVWHLHDGVCEALKLSQD